MTALYAPPKKHMTKRDWEKVHCNGSQGCMMAKSKGLSPPEYSVNCRARVACEKQLVLLP